MSNQKENTMPNVYLVGPTRTATTWIYRQLAELGDFDLAKGKETYFFDKRISKGADWYLAQYKNDGRTKIDISPTYFASDDARERIKDYIRDPVIIIIILRNQIDLLLSSYKFCVQHNNGDMRFAKFIRTKESKQFDYLHYVPLWIRDYGQDNVHFLYFSDIENNPQYFINELYKLSNVKRSENFVLNDVLRNSSGLKPRNKTLYSLAKVVAAMLRPVVGGMGVAFVKEKLLKDVLFKRNNEQVVIDESTREYICKLFGSPDQELTQYVHDNKQKLNYMSICND